MSGTETIRTPLTKLLGIDYPIILAGMNKAAGPELAAVVSNAGGLGVIGGVFMSPRILKLTIDVLKKNLAPDKQSHFGVDLLIPKVGGSARKTNTDYTGGQLDELVDVIIASKPKLFVCAVGVPPQWVVEKFHKHNILCANMIGHPKHVDKACAQGIDIIIAQGGEGGGHTGHVATSILIPKVVDLCKNYKSPLTGELVHVVAAGGIYDGRGLAMSLALGAQAVWVGTRFVCSTEAGAPIEHKKAIINATYDDTERTLVYTGRPLRVVKNDYVKNWETERKEEMDSMLKKGVIPFEHELSQQKQADLKAFGKRAEGHLAGQVSGAIKDIKPAKEIIQDMMTEAIRICKQLGTVVTDLPKSKL